MRVEAVCTGDELLTGLTTDTNTTYFAGKLFALGEQLARVQVVGDDKAEIVAALKLASARADALLVSGGLGPTADDLTAECAALVAQVPLVENKEALEHLHARFAERKIKLTPNNLKQALVPQGAEVFVGGIGSAPMFVLQLGRCTTFFVAGVPREYRHWVDLTVLPRLQRLRQEDAQPTFRAARLLKTVGMAESHLDAQVAPLARLHPNVIFGFRTQAPENHLKLVAVGSNQDEANRTLAAVEKPVRELLKEAVFGADEETLGGVVGKLLLERQATVATAESCTGGLLGERLTASPGASAYFVGGSVAYANSMKEKWMSVPRAELENFGAVSAEVAESLARGVRAAAGTTYGVSVTGIAGPEGGTPEKPVGTVFVGLAMPQGTMHRKFLFPGDRELIRAFSAHAAMNLLRLVLLGAIG